MKFCFLIPFVFLKSLFLFAQNTNDLKVCFSLIYDKYELKKDTLYVTKLNQDVRISNFKFYVSKFKITYEDGSSLVDENGYHLISLDSLFKENSFSIEKKANGKIKKFSFYIGVDEEKSLSGEMNGDLDPMSGMFWSWQTGFSSFKIEGVSSFSKARKQEFLFHIGGYLDPYNSLREIVFEVESPPELVVVQVDLKKILDKINFENETNIMSPGDKAMQLADIFQNTFSLK